MKIYAPNIFIDGNAQSTVNGQVFTPTASLAENYEEQVANWLDAIARTISGEVLLREIRRGPKGTNLRIIPYPKENAITQPNNPLGATPFGQQLRFGGDIPNTPQIEKAGQLRFDAQNKPMIGTGDGANVTILYHPSTWMQHSYRTGQIGNLMPDDVLVHELMHGLRMMEGLVLSTEMGSDSETDRFENKEEFYALLVANIYVSELNKKQGRRQALRGNISAPDRFQALVGDEAISEKFYQSHKAAVDALCNEQIGLTHGGGLKGLQHAPGDFNPIRNSTEFHDALRMKMYATF